MNPSVVDKFRETVIWIKAAAILAMVGAVVTVLQSLLTAGEMESQMSGLGSGFGAIMVVSTMIPAIIMVVFKVILLNYGNKLSVWAETGHPDDFANAMESQKNYWVFFGVLVIIFMAFGLLGLLAVGASGIL